MATIMQCKKILKSFEKSWKIMNNSKTNLKLFQKIKAIYIMILPVYKIFAWNLYFMTIKFKKFNSTNGIYKNLLKNMKT